VSGQFVSRETTRLGLPDGHWIEVKAQLSYREQSQLNARMYGRVTQEALAAGGEGLGVDLESMAIEFLAIWLVDWSFRDEHDKPVALSRDAIGALDPDWADKVQAAIGQHVQALSLGKATPDGKPRRAARSAS
jgi:hypothetical protein